ncbi:MAG TPA: TolC family protein [Campylobacterales bacterium]|nr:TolC family protein [Campylobacterales bacterium]
MKRIIFTISFSALLFGASDDYPVKPKSLTLQEAVKAALMTHPDAKIALHRLEIAEVDAAISKSDFRPNITLNGEYFPRKTIITQANGALSAKEFTTTHIGAALVYTLWDFGKTKNRFDAASNAIYSSKFASKTAQFMLVEKVWQTFYLVAYHNRLAASYRHTVAFYEALHKQASEMRKNGLKTVADEERFFASALDAKDALLNIENESKKAILNLSLLTSLSVDNIQIVDNFDNSKIVKIDTKDDEEWKKELLSGNTELKLLDRKIKQSESLLEAYKAEDYGSITAIASVARDNSFSYYNSSSVGVRASIPLYSGGKLTAQKERAKAAIMEAKEEFRLKEMLLWQELYSAIVDARSVDNSIRAKSAIMESAIKTVEITSNRYKEGVASYIDVLESKAALENAQNGKNSAMLKKIIIIAKIRRLISNEETISDTGKY